MIKQNLKVNNYSYTYLTTGTARQEFPGKVISLNLPKYT
jgi:hypothetical protein